MSHPSAELGSKLLKLECEAILKEKSTGYEPTNKINSVGSGESFDLPYSVILNVRKQKEMIELLPRRRKYGDQNADCIASKVDDGLSFVETFPGHCYRPVKFCLNCYVVCNLVENVRKKCKTARDARRDLTKHHGDFPTVAFTSKMHMAMRGPQISKLDRCVKNELFRPEEISVVSPRQRPEFVLGFLGVLTLRRWENGLLLHECTNESIHWRTFPSLQDK